MWNLAGLELPLRPGGYASARNTDLNIPTYLLRNSCCYDAVKTLCQEAGFDITHDMVCSNNWISFDELNND